MSLPCLPADAWLDAQCRSSPSQQGDWGVTRLTNDLTNPAQGSQIGTQSGGSAGVTPCRHGNRCWRHSRGQEVGAAFPCCACSEGLAAGQDRTGGSPPHPQLSPWTPQLIFLSECRYVVDMWDPHLPPGTAAMGPAGLAAPNSPSALGTLILLEQLLTQNPGCCLCKAKTHTVPRDRDKWGVDS